MDEISDKLIELKFHHWYEVADLKLLEQLKKYKIVNYLEEAFAQPIKSGRFLFKNISPLFTYKKS